MNLNPNIEQAKKNHLAWWNRKGMVLNLRSPKRNPTVKELTNVPKDRVRLWTDAVLRCDGAEYDMGKTAYFADSLPMVQTTFGPGSLAEMLGAKPVYEPSTVWYEPCIADPDACGPIRFNPRNNASLDLHMRFVDEAVRRSNGRYMVAMSDLIENLDTLASLRGSEPLLMDLVERPQWVHQRQEEILQAFFEVFELFYQKTKDAQGGSAFIFDLWGPGRTCKVQCDFSCMISASMFREFVVPYLSRQCDFLDYSMYHLDGETALQHLDALLSIESLDAIEWTPMGAYGGSPVSHTGGHPQWYDLYRRIKTGGKSVQAVGVEPKEVVPLLDAVGPEGMYIMTRAADEDEAQKLVEQVQEFR